MALLLVLSLLASPCGAATMAGQEAERERAVTQFRESAPLLKRYGAQLEILSETYSADARREKERLASSRYTMALAALLAVLGFIVGWLSRRTAAS